MAQRIITFNIHDGNTSSDDDELGLNSKLQGSNDDSDSHDINLPPISSLSISLPVTIQNDEFLNLIEKQKKEAGEILKSKPLDTPNYVRPHPYKTENFHSTQKKKKGVPHQVFYQTQLSVSSSSSSSNEEEKPQQKKNDNISLKTKNLSSSEEEQKNSLKGKKEYSYSDSEDDIPVVNEKKQIPLPKKEPTTSKTIEKNNSKTIDLNKSPFLKSNNKLILKSSIKERGNDHSIYESSNLENVFKPKKNIESCKEPDTSSKSIPLIIDQPAYYYAYLNDESKNMLLKTQLNWHCTIKGITRPGHPKLNKIHKFNPIEDNKHISLISGMLTHTDLIKTKFTDNVSIIIAEKLVADKKEMRYWMNTKTVLNKKVTNVTDYEINTSYGGHIRVYDLLYEDITNNITLSQFFDKDGHSKIIDLEFSHPETGKEISNLFVIHQKKPFILTESHTFFIHLQDDNIPTMVLAFYHGTNALYQLWVFYGLSEQYEIDSNLSTNKKTNDKDDTDQFYHFLQQL